MTRTRCAALLLALAAAPSGAAEIYVPYAAGRDDGSARHRVEVIVTNTQPSLAQNVSYRVLSGDVRGKSVARTLEGGESQTLTGFGAVARRGVVALDLAEGVAARARLVTERPNGSRTVVELPAIGARNAFAGGGLATLQGLERDALGRTTGIGVINLGAATATCRVSLRSGAGAPIGASSSFPLAAGAETFQDDVLAAYSDGTLAGALATVECSDRFYAYGVVEDDAGSEAELVAPSYESLAALAPATILPRPETSNSTFFRLPGEFLVCSRFNTNWQYNMGFGSTKTFKRVKLDFKFYVSGWDSHNKGGFHCVFWFNNGSRWSSMAGYVNLLGNKSKTRMEINQPVYVRHSSSGSPQPGGNYAMHYEIDYTPGNKVAWYTIKQGSNTIKSHSYNHNQSGFQTSRTFIQFGTQVAPEGPEASTYGWRFSDFTAEYEP